MTTQSLPSLYDRLGGVYSIATVVDDFIDRIMIDPRLNANPEIDEAHHRVPPFEMFALPPKADIDQHGRDVCFVPKADIASATR